MSEELKRAQARQRLKRVMEREQAKLPNIEPGASNKPIELIQTTKSEEQLSQEELRKQLFTIIKDSEQVDNIIDNINLASVDSVPLLVENFKEMVADLKKTYKSGVAFPQLRGFILRYAKKLLKQVEPAQNITYQTGPGPQQRADIVDELLNFRSLLARSKLVIQGPTTDEDIELLNKLIESNTEVLSNVDELKRLQALIKDGYLVPYEEVNKKEQELLDDFSRRNADQIAVIANNLSVSQYESSNIPNVPEELTDRELAKLAQLKPYTDKDVKINTQRLSREDKVILTTNLRTILTDTLGPNRSDVINEILDSFNKGLANPIKTLSKKLQRGDPVSAGDMINPTAPLVVEWRNKKLNELMKDPYYRAKPEEIKPMVEEMSKQMFGYGIKKKKQ